MTAFPSPAPDRLDHLVGGLVVRHDWLREDDVVARQWPRLPDAAGAGLDERGGETTRVLLAQPIDKLVQFLLWIRDHCAS